MQDLEIRTVQVIQHVKAEGENHLQKLPSDLHTQDAAFAPTYICNVHGAYANNNNHKRILKLCKTIESLKISYKFLQV